MSDTPETDAEECWHVYEDGFHSIEKVDEKHRGMGSHVPIKFARKLERERNQLRKVADELAMCLQNPAIFQRMESIDAIANYNSLPHVIKRNKAK